MKSFAQLNEEIELLEDAGDIVNMAVAASRAHAKAFPEWGTANNPRDHKSAAAFNHNDAGWRNHLASAEASHKVIQHLQKKHKWASIADVKPEHRDQIEFAIHKGWSKELMRKGNEARQTPARKAMISKTPEEYKKKLGKASDITSERYKDTVAANGHLNHHFGIDTK